MRLSKEAIREFKDIYYKEFKEKISDKEAQEMGANLLSLFEIVYRPISKPNTQEPGDRRKRQSSESV
ncbi:MAG: hypothetical protein CEE38_13710 [Planctomycetes bacterium B3_Pla]|nr:MAG: hypothetical protein CEE38_13710 [Planctomycetes bacterium B3_Pla]